MTRMSVPTASALIAISLLAACSKSTPEAPAAAAERTLIAPQATAPSTGAPATPVAPSPRNFADDVAMSDMYEIDAARIAEARSRNAEVKKFAAMMVADHSKSSAALKAIVAKSPALGPLPTRLDTAHAMMIADLKAADAAKFDKLYLNQQIKAHQNAESLLSNYATDGSDAALKNFASTTVPKVAGHLHMVQTMTGDALAGPVAPVG